MQLSKHNKPLVNYWVIPSIKTTFSQRCFLNKIIEFVEEVTMVDRLDILSRTRTKDFVLARHLVFYFCMKYSSWPQTKRKDPKRSLKGVFKVDHSSLIHAHDKITDYLELVSEVDTQYKVKKIEAKIISFKSEFKITDK